jgi:hypothetical protein
MRYGRGWPFSRNARFKKKAETFLLYMIFRRKKMKRFWLVLLSLGLIVAFSTSAMAVDVKFSGEYYAAGLYLNKTNLVGGISGATTEGPSTAFYYQRLRLNTTFVVSPGLFLTTRMDMMERAWGATRSTPNATLDTMSAGTRAENENIAVDLAYVTYISPIGIFAAGYMIDGAWGNVWGDSSVPTGKITYTFVGGPVTIGLQSGKNINGLTGKGGEFSSGTFAGATLNAADRDDTFATAFGLYTWKNGSAGVLGKYFWLKSSRGLGAGLPGGIPDSGIDIQYFVLIPTVKAQLGPVAIKADFYWLTGKQKYESYPTNTPDVAWNAYSAWVDAVGDFGMFYVGGTLAYASGDDQATTDKKEGNILGGGYDYNPCLIMFNNDLNYWAGNQAGYDGTANAGAMTNVYFAQVRAGVRPVEKLDLMASVSWAHAEKAGNSSPANTGVWDSRDYGYEIDLTATYKITNNLSYMLGGGYFKVGDWYKGKNTAAFNDINNDFMVINKLTLTF